MDIEQNTPLDSGINPTNPTSLDHQLPVAAQYYLRLAAQFALWLFWIRLVTEVWSTIMQLDQYFNIPQHIIPGWHEVIFTRDYSHWGFLISVVSFCFWYWYWANTSSGIATHSPQKVGRGLNALTNWFLCSSLSSVWTFYLILLPLGAVSTFDSSPVAGMAIALSGIAVFLGVRFVLARSATRGTLNNGLEQITPMKHRFQQLGRGAWVMFALSMLSMAVIQGTPIVQSMVHFSGRSMFLKHHVTLLLTLLWVNLPLVFLFLFAKNITQGGAAQGSAHLTKGLRYLVFWLLATVLLHGQGALSSLLQLGIKNNPFMSYLVYILTVLATCAAFYFWQRRLVRQEPRGGD